MLCWQKLRNIGKVLERRIEEKEKRDNSGDTANKQEILKKVNPGAARLLTREYTTVCIVNSSEHLCCVYYNNVFIVGLGPLGATGYDYDSMAQK